MCNFTPSAISLGQQALASPDLQSFTDRIHACIDARTPQMSRCETCNGSGEVTTRGLGHDCMQIRCPECRGVGAVRP